MKKSGFTLIELAIVLVIIGILTSGILIGQHITEQSKISNFVSQMGQIDGALATFKSKYNYLPGDIPNAIKLGLDKDKNGVSNTAFVYGDTSNTDGNGDGNVGELGMDDLFAGEMMNFWVHLSNSAIYGAFQQTGGCDFLGDGCERIAGKSFPKPKIGNGILAKSAEIIARGESGTNFKKTLQYLTGFTLDADGSVSLSLIDGWLSNYSLTPAQAYSIDLKMDNGKGDSGKAFAFIGYPQYIETYPADDIGLSTCYDTFTGEYLVDIDEQVCNLSIKAAVQ